MTKMTERSFDITGLTSPLAIPPLTIRAMEQEDLPCLLEMIHALQMVTKDQLLLDKDALIDLLYAPNPWARILVAEQNGALIGYTALVGGLQLSPIDRAMQMHHLYVRPEHREKGVARALTQSARSVAHHLGCGTLSVGIMSTSETAKAAYRAVGFQRRTPRAPRYEMALV
ncbi:GNAT family N-acetyltransferase [Celeribacter sp. PS-C1]|uniref:GNAT family N-acetyltransferase n=1 Tax=Celeribacter sp. PS-C1 TaxID=2820813 RepID=UPI001C6757D5|nr:GNAT family N-acetyltransferase [Celeribacter sp. PS-C1]MBW6417100.1 GNAT family N-acetyltransferase [Celeribacter sp. PS-C1]